MYTYYMYTYKYYIYSTCVFVFLSDQNMKPFRSWQHFSIHPNLWSQLPGTHYAHQYTSIHTHTNMYKHANGVLNLAFFFFFF